MLQHNEVIDIRSKPTFVPRGHHHLFSFLLCLFVFLLVFPFACLLAILLVYYLFCSFACIHAILAISILLIRFASFCYYLCIFIPLLVYWFLVFSSACTYMERGHIELGHGLPSVRKKAQSQVWAKQLQSVGLGFSLSL